MSRRTTIAAALISAAALSLAAAPAARAAGTITVVGASSQASDVGLLSVELQATTAITSLTAHIITASHTDVLDLGTSAFTLSSGSATSGVWTLKQPITLQQLTLGTYTVTVDAADSGGDSVTGVSAGSLDFLIEPTVTLSAGSLSLDYSNPTTTLSGTVTGLWPDGTTKPLPDLLVSITGVNVYPLLTDGSGSFSVQVTPYATADYAASVGVYGQIANADSATVIVTVNSAPTAISVTVSPSTAGYGQPVTISGQLTYQPASTWLPLADVQLAISIQGVGLAAMPVTDSSGHFSATVYPIAGGQVSLSFGSGLIGPQYPGLNPSQATANLNVVLPSSITQFTASVDQFGALSVHGCLTIAHLLYSYVGSTRSPVIIQYAVSPAGPWQRLGAITSLASGDLNCGVTQAAASFTGSFPVKLAKAYYRAYFPGDQNAMWGSSSSNPIFAGRALTQIVSLAVSATHVSRGGKLTIRGRLMQYANGWHPYGGRQVLIMYRKPSRTTWYWILKVTTTSTGWFSATFKDTFSATWSAFYAGDGTHYVTSPAGIFVRVG